MQNISDDIDDSFSFNADESIISLGDISMSSPLITRPVGRCLFASEESINNINLKRKADEDACKEVEHKFRRCSLEDHEEITEDPSFSIEYDSPIHTPNSSRILFPDSPLKSPPKTPTVSSFSRRSRDNDELSSTTNLNPFMNGNKISDSSCNSSIDRYAHSHWLSTRSGSISRYIEDFQEVCCIGKGTFGCVYKCIKRMDGVSYAIKELRISKKITKQTILQEVYALSALSCRGDFNKHIVRYFSAWCEDEKLYLQMELCELTLDKYLLNVKVNEEKIKRIMKAVLKGLAFLHNQYIVHLDIKPENIFIHNDVFKIGDLGFATLRNGMLSVTEGDCRYMAPELLNEDYSDLSKADIYSLGIMMYEIIRNKPLPYAGDEWLKLRENKFESLGSYFKLEVIIRKMMNSDPDKRPSAASILQDPYFKGKKSNGNSVESNDNCKKCYCLNNFKIMRSTTM